MKKLKRYIKRKLGISLSVPEIIDIVLENQDVYSTGLCKWLTNLYSIDKLNWYEFHKLWNLIISNSEARPYKVYWWREGDINPRIEFLQQLKAKYD